MGIWDGLDPKLKALKQAYAQYHAQYDQLVNNVHAMHDNYVNLLTNYRSLVVYNSALVVIGSVLKMTNDQFDNLISKNTGPVPGINDRNAIPQDVLNFLSSKTGGSFIIDAIYQLNSTSNDPAFAQGVMKVFAGITAVQDVLYGLACGGLGLIPGADKIPDGLRQVLSLPLQAVAFIDAVVVDIITGPFQLAGEEAQYNEALNKISRAINNLMNTQGQLSSAMNSINQESANQRSLFSQIIQKLNAIKPATFNIAIDFMHADISQVIACQMAAADEYGIVVQIKGDWVNTLKSTPDITEAGFIAFELTSLSRANFTKEEMRSMIVLVLHPDGPPNTIILSGHSDANYNGTYIATGQQYNGKPVYKSAKNAYIFYQKQHLWVLQPAPPSDVWNANNYVDADDPTASGWKGTVKLTYGT